MCGVAGILSLASDRESQERSIKRMVSALSHRGPDGWGVYLAPNVALGNTRLSIIDLAGGNQPMKSDRYIIAYNGEIYNYIELRQELRGKGVRFE